VVNVFPVFSGFCLEGNTKLLKNPKTIDKENSTISMPEASWFKFFCGESEPAIPKA
jgi:hypothetical protein